MTKITEKFDNLSSLISPRRDIKRPVYNWHSFKHSYSKELVDLLIKKFNLKEGTWVLDPFCGGGTTLLACKELGINSRGYDILPFSVFLSNVKTRDYNIQQLIEANKSFIKSNNISSKSHSLPDIPIAKKAFSLEIENILLALKKRINTIKEHNTRDFLMLCLLSILEEVSNTSKAGGFLRIVQKEIEPQTIEEILKNIIIKRVHDVLNYKLSLNGHHADVSARVGDARKIRTQKKFDAIITSPPYPNRHDYTRIYGLEMIFDFITSNNELKKVRYETIRSHVEARQKYKALDYVQPKTLSILIDKIKNNGVNNSQVLDMIDGYFEDMYLALCEMKRCLNKSGQIALVVSNVRFAGINLPVDELLSEIGKQAGLKPKGIWIARLRGNSSQQMRDYKRIPSRESIVFWSK